MSDDTRFDRREFLRAGGVVATGAAIAGCTDTGGGGEQDPADGDNGTEGAGTNESAGNETDANESAGNETDANESAGNESDGNQSGNQSRAAATRSK